MKKTIEEVLSPITDSNNVILLEQFDSASLINSYQKQFDIDISYLFVQKSLIDLYECLDTGYRFYYPFSTAGDDGFYGHFGKFDWYYLPWKWEHQQCANILKDGDSVLEVGAGKGDFINALSKLKNIEATGLELNSAAISLAVGTNTKLINQSIEDHAEIACGRYDMVCSFQVLEHIPKTKEFLQAMIKSLKPKGKLLISVPNNDSFIGTNILPSKILNMPPHHMGLWDKKALKSLENYFPITLKELIIEPLQAIHSNTYHYNLVYKIFFRSKFLIRIYWKLRLYILVRPIINLFANQIIGHSIIAIYEKKQEA